MPFLDEPSGPSAPDALDKEGGAADGGTMHASTPGLERVSTPSPGFSERLSDAGEVSSAFLPKDIARSEGLISLVDESGVDTSEHGGAAAEMLAVPPGDDDATSLARAEGPATASLCNAASPSASKRSLEREDRCRLGVDAADCDDTAGPPPPALPACWADEPCRISWKNKFAASASSC